MNTDGRTYILLKKAGFINNKRAFITQPTQDDIDKASAPSEGGFFGGIFGGDK
jgi:ABC-type metal ion transport system substrate-binding protein